MAHELSKKKGVYEAAFAGEKPWHGLGALLTDKMTPDQALKAAHLNWTVSAAPIEIHREFGGEKIPDRRAMIRDDDYSYLGIVGMRYVPIQNAECAEWIEALVGAGAHVECAGALFGGRRIFWTLRIPGEMVSDGDELERYLIVSNSHDGSGTFKAYWSTIRVVCSNTLQFSMRDAKSGVSLRHTTNIKSRVEAAREVLGIANKFYESAAEKFTKLGKRKMKMDEFLKEFLPMVYGIEDDEMISTRRQNQFMLLADNFAHAPGASKTAWGAFNAVTFQTSHQSGKSGEDQFDYLYEGVGKRVSEKAFDVAMAMSV